MNFWKRLLPSWEWDVVGARGRGKNRRSNRRPFRPWVEQLEARETPAYNIDVINPNGVLVAEGGTTGNYVVQLDADPLATVKITLTAAGVPTQLKVNGATFGVLTFNSANWNIAQSMAISAIDDGIAEGPHQGLITFTNVTAPVPDNSGRVVTASITDNDPGVIVRGTEVPSGFVNGFNKIFTLTQTPNTGSLSLTTVNRGAQTPPTDYSLAGNTITFVVAPAIGDVLSATYQAPNAAVTETPFASGGINDTYTINLSTQPTANVVINFNSPAQVQAPSVFTPLTFTPANWFTPQLVTVVAVDDSIATTVPGSTYIALINHTISTTDGVYALQTVTNVNVNITENDQAGITRVGTEVPTGLVDGINKVFTLTQTPTANTLVLTVNGVTQTLGTDFTLVTRTITFVNPPLTGSVLSATYQCPNVDVTEGGISDTFTVALTSQPNGTSVTLSFIGNQVTTTPSNLVFTNTNWFNPQTVTVSAINDLVQEVTPHNGTITASVTGGGYNLAPAGPVTFSTISANVSDNDVAGIVLNESGGSTTVTEGGGADTFTVVLATQPASGVTVNFAFGAQISLAGSVSFSTLDWFTPKTVSVTAVDDLIGELFLTTVITCTTGTADPFYAAVADPNPITVNVNDNDVAAVILSKTSSVLTEGGSDSYTVRLATRPTSNVTITIGSAPRLSVAPTVLTFVPLAGGAIPQWDIPQTVNIAAPRDGDIQGTSGGTISSVANGGGVSPPGYTGVVIPDFTYTVNDADSVDVFINGVTADASLTVAEQLGAGPPPHVQTYNVTLNSRPTVTTTITFTNPSTDFVISPTTVTFNAGVFPITAAVITVTAQDLGFVDGTRTAVITAVCNAPGEVVPVAEQYNLRAVPNVSVTVIDNDIAGVAVQESSVSGNWPPPPPAGPFTTNVTEGSAIPDMIRVSLVAQPISPVLVTLTPDAQIALSATVLTFDPFSTLNLWSNWQTVNVLAVNDGIVEGAHLGLISITSSGTAYNLAPAAPTVSVNVTDNDSVTVIKTFATTTLTEGTFITGTVTLLSQPTSDVFILLNSSLPGDFTVFPPALTFTGGTWPIVPQTITVFAPDNAIVDGTRVGTISQTVSGDIAYTALSPLPPITITVNDDEVGKVLITSAPSITVNEPTTADTFSVVLNAQPSSNVAVSLVTPPLPTLTPFTLSATSLTFSTANWNVPQLVTVTAKDDFVDQAPANMRLGTITITPSGGSFTGAAINVNGVDTAAALTVTVLDNDTAGLSIVELSGTTITEVVTPGPTGTDTFTVALSSQPATGAVAVTLSFAAGQFNVSPTSFNFTTANWNTPRSVTVTVIDDMLGQGTHLGTISLTTIDPAADANFDPVSATVTVTIIDNEVPSVLLSTNSANVTEGGPGTTVNVSLNTVPTGNVTVTFTASSDASLVTTLSVATLTFDNVNWSIAQPLVIFAADDAIAEGPHVGSITTTASGGSYDTVLIAPIVVNVTDNDTAGVILSKNTTNVIEGGGADTYTIRLNSEPTAAVAIVLTPSLATQFTVSPTTVSFTSLNWNMPQMITVAAVDDAIREGGAVLVGSITYAVSSSDTKYDLVPVPNGTVNITDDDNQGVTVVQSGGLTSVVEGGANDTYTLVLDSPPTAGNAVTVNFTNANGQVAVSLNPIVFTTANWSTVQTVTVSAMDDTLAETSPHFGVITHNLVSGDGRYNGFVLADVTASVTDDDTPGFTFVATGNALNVSESGVTDTYTVVLNSNPTMASVTFNATSADGQVALSPASLIFDSTNWNVPQTIVVSGVNDATLENSPNTGVINHSLVTTDPKYIGFSVPSLTASIIDDDSPIGKTFVDSDGDTYVLTMTGAGLVSMVQNPNGSIDQILLQNTIPSSTTVTITVTQVPGGNGLVDINLIQGSSGLKTISAGSCNLVSASGGIQIAGAVGSIFLRDIKNGADITLGGLAIDKTFLTVSQVGDGSNMTLGSALTLRAFSFGAGGTITTPIVSLLNIPVDPLTGIAGDFLGNVSAGQVINATIAGDMSQSDWTLTGGVTAITVHGQIDSWNLIAAGSVAALTLGDVQSATVQAGFEIGTVLAKRWAGGSIKGTSLKTLNILGEAANSIVGDFLGDITVNALGKVFVAGNVNAATGSIWAVTGTSGLFGKVDTVAIKGAIENWSLTVDKDMSFLDLGDVVSASVQVSNNLSRVEVDRWSAGSVKAFLIPALKVTGNGPSVPGDFLADINVSNLTSATVAGSVGSSSWNIASVAKDITIAGAIDQWNLTAGSITSLLMTDVTSANVQIAGTAGKVQATRWLAGSLQAKTLTAFDVVGNAKANISGDFLANLNVDALGSAHVVGNIADPGGASWSITGNARSIIIDALEFTGGVKVPVQIDNLTITVGGFLTTLTLGQVASADIQVHFYITTLNAVRWDAGTLNAASIATFKINGDKKNSIAGDFGGQVTLTGLNVIKGGKALTTAIIAGTVQDASFLIAGNVGAFTTGVFANSSLLVGYVPNDPSNPFGGGSFTKGVTLASFAAKGIVGSVTPSFSASTVAASKITNATMTTLTTDNGGTSFGILARESIARVTATVPKFTYSVKGGNPQGIGDFKVFFI